MKINSYVFPALIRNEFDNWEITLLSTSYDRINIYNYKNFMRYKVAKGIFSVRLDKDGKIKNTDSIKLQNVFKQLRRKVKTAVIKINVDATMIVEVGIRKEINLCANEIVNGSNIIIDIFNLEMEIYRDDKDKPEI